MKRRLLVAFARHSSRMWTTLPLALADRVALYRSGDWELALTHHHRTTRRPTR